MNQYEKIKEYYTTGRFECDLFFYETLLQIVKELTLFEYCQELDKNIKVIIQIRKLTARHLYLLQEMDTQDEALQLAQKSKDLLNKINTSIVEEIMINIEKMKFQSFSQKLIDLGREIGYAESEGIIKRVEKSIKDDKLRLQSLLVVGLFMLKNKNNWNAKLQLYEKAISSGIKQLKEFRERSEFILNHPQIVNNQKAINYVKGSFVMILALIHFNQIYKLVSGNGGFGLKLNALRKQIEMKNWKLYNKQSASYSEEIPFSELKLFLRDGEPFLPFQTICDFCLRRPALHLECKNVLSLLLK